MAIISPSINASIYREGIEATILTNNSMAIALLGDNGEVLAGSAIINATSTESGGTSESSATKVGLSGQITFTDETKTLHIPTIEYFWTKDFITSDTGTQAYNFALYKIKGEGAGSEAFEGSGKFYKFPALDDFEESNILIVGKLTGNPVVNKKSNFRLTETNIVFSEVEA